MNDEPLLLELKAFDLVPGAVCVLFGKSGVGKTTLLESFAGLRAPAVLDHFKLTTLSGENCDLGEAYASQRSDRFAKLRSGPIGYVPQGGGVLPFLSAKDNILLGTPDPATANERLNRLAEWFDMEGHLAKKRAALSGGQRKRVALMRGLIQPRALLLLDEPTSGLDGDLADKALELIQDFAIREASSAIIVMHDVDRAERQGLPILEMVKGENRTVQLRQKIEMPA